MKDYPILHYVRCKFKVSLSYSLSTQFKTFWPLTFKETSLPRLFWNPLNNLFSIMLLRQLLNQF